MIYQVDIFDKDDDITQKLGIHLYRTISFSIEKFKHLYEMTLEDATMLIGTPGEYDLDVFNTIINFTVTLYSYCDNPKCKVQVI